MNSIRNILLIKVGIIILLHALISHRHQVEMTYEEHVLVHERADDVLDFFGLWFHQDSNKVLDNYVAADFNLIKKFKLKGFNFSANHSPLKAEIIFSGISQYFESQPLNLFHDFLVRSNGLRAPPCSGFYA